MVTSSFQKLRRSKGITIHQIANVAGIAPREELLFEIGARIDQKRAEDIVLALNVVSGEQYTLADFLEPIAEQPTTPVPAIPIRRMSWQKHLRST
jgi:transcriptional regulator with XRE-family HTH domain